jgi:hypothetical protein
MADTRYLKSIVEDHVRTWLKDQFGQSFKSIFLTLSGVQVPREPTNSTQSLKTA